MAEQLYASVYDETPNNSRSTSQTDKIRVLNMTNDVEKLPDCSERSTMQLLLQIENFTYNDGVSDEVGADMLTQLNIVEEQLMAERRSTAELVNDLQKVRSAINSHNWSTACHVVHKVLKILRPLDVAEIRRLVTKGSDAAKRIRNQAVVLLVGATGAGKSTTIQFLAGCQMEKTRVPMDSTYLEHISVIGQLPQQDLAEITTSPLARSETRYIVPVTIPLGAIYEDNQEGSIILCDAPGFGDTAGPEVNIANSVVVNDALGSCKSVKIFALSSFEAKGDRGEGIIQLANILSGIIDNIEEHSNAFVYGFTKYPSDRNPLADLLNIQKSVANQHSHECFAYILKDMIKKAKKGTIKINPLEYSERQDLVDKLSQASEIKYPQDKFKLSMSKETHSVIHDYVQKTKDTVRHAAVACNFPIVLYCMDDLKTLVSLVKGSSIAAQAYEECAQIASEILHKKYKQTREDFCRALTCSRGLHQSDIDRFKMAIECFERAVVIKNHLGLQTIEPEALREYMIAEVKRLRASVNSKAYHSQEFKVYLETVSLLKDTFTEIKDPYEECCRNVTERFQHLVQVAKQNVNDFSGLAENLRNIFLMNSALHKYLLLDSEAKNSDQQIIKILSEYLRDQITIGTAIVQQGIVQNDDVKKLDECERILKSAKENVALVNAVAQCTGDNSRCDVLNEIYETFINKIVNHVEKLDSKIRTHLDNENCRMYEVKELVKQMESLRSIQEVANKTVNAYYQSRANINDKFQQITRSWDELLPTLDDLLDNKNHFELRKLLSQLKNLEWIKEINPSAHTALVQVYDEIQEHLKRLQMRLVLILDRSKKQAKKLDEINELLRQANTWSELGKNIPCIAEAAGNILKKCFDIVNEIIQQYKSNYSIKDKHSISVELTRLEKIKRDFLSMQKQNVEMEISLNEESVADNQAERTPYEFSEQGISDAFQRIHINDAGSIAGQQNQKKRIAKHTEHNMPDYDAYTANNELSTEADQYASLFLKDPQNHLDVDIVDDEKFFDAQSSLIDPNSYLKLHKFQNAASLDELIQRIHEQAKQLEKCGQQYYFEKLDLHTVEYALEYTSCCEEMLLPAIRQNATVATATIQKYLKEYGIFLNGEVENNLQILSNRALSNDSSLNSADIQNYANQIELRFQELNKFSKSSAVFNYINGDENLQRWKSNIRMFLTNLRDQTQSDYMSGSDRLNNRLVAARASLSFESFADIAFSDGFGALCQKYQQCLSDECKEIYRKVISSINEFDYEKAAFELAQIDENGLAPKFIAQIRNDLNCSLIKLVKDTRSKAIWLNGRWEEENLTQDIQQIIENVDKLRKACNKEAITAYLDTDTQKMLLSDEKFIFSEEIDNILSQGLLKLLETAEYSIDNNGFLEAETIMDRFSKLQQSLDSLCRSPALLSKYNQLKNNLDKIADLILEKNDFHDYENYWKNSPKALIEKLKFVAERRLKYQQVLPRMLQKIDTTLNDVLSNVKKANYDQREKKLLQLGTACRYLPEELQESFKEKIASVKQDLKNVDKMTTKNIRSIVDSDRGDAPSIKKISDCLRNLQDDQFPKHFEKLSELVTQKVTEIRKKVNVHLYDNQWAKAIEEVQNIYLYSSVLSHHINELKVIFEDARDAFRKAFSKLLKVLQNSSYENYSPFVETSVINITICLSLLGNDQQEDNCKHFTLIENQEFGEAVEELQKFYDFLKEKSEIFSVSLLNRNVYGIEQVVPILQQWSGLLEKTAAISNTNQTMLTLQNDCKRIPSTDSITANILAMIQQLKDCLTVELMNNDTIQYENYRETFFRELAKSYTTLIEAKERLHKLLSATVQIEDAEKESLKAIRAKVEKLGNIIVDFFNNARPSKEQCDEFRSVYHHLASFNKHFRSLGLNTEHNEQATKNMHATVATLRSKMDVQNWNTTVVAQNLITMKFLADNLFMFQDTINNEINSCLQCYKTKSGADMIFKLCMILEGDEVGAKLISEHACLKGEDWSKRREKMQKQDNLEYVMQDLEGNNIARDYLESRFNVFRETYNELIKLNLPLIESNPTERLESLSIKAKMIIGKYYRSGDNWRSSFMDQLPELVAHIFAIWTLQNTEYYNALRGIAPNESYLLMPHCAQVIAIFRILGIGYIEKASSTMEVVKSLFRGKKLSNKLVNNFVQMGTGEGKSVVMAVVASVFALTGVDVNCCCYSDYLSKRDQEAFSSLFQTLKISDRIEYGTFNKLCEHFLNTQCNVRERVRKLLMSNQQNQEPTNPQAIIRPKVLLIDEVDVFLSEKFYGGCYTPSVLLTDSSVKSLLDVVWKNKFGRLRDVQSTQEYLKCINRFSNWNVLVDEAIKDALLSLRSFKSSTHIVDCDRIKYVEGDSVAENVLLGYDTVWAYYYEHDNGNISEASLANNVGFIVKCGTFSYAEMPLDFAYISGVTGTLQTLANAEKDILRNIYGIERYTYMPSVFGKCNRNYNPISDVHVINKAEYFMRLRDEIDVMRNAKRAVLMFFDSEERLNEFYNSSELLSVKKQTQLITERISAADRELYVNRAATEGQVTLLTRTYGRGTDFVCRNPQLLANGGLHVVQTFFSEEQSEEYQIMGRSARQGDPGSYRMILLDSDLEWILGAQWADQVPKIMGSECYKHLNEARLKRYDSLCGGKKLAIDQCKREHNESIAFMNAIISGNIQTVQNFIFHRNCATNFETISRTILLMDATGSMYNLLSAAKDTVCTMFGRASEILEDKGFTSAVFQLQFVVYRDYDCGLNDILQASPWQTKPEALRAFMAGITAKGGGPDLNGVEAIEIGLWHSVHQSEEPDGVSQVILIGDAAAKDEATIKKHREQYGGEKLWRQKFGPPTHYTKELDKLRSKSIPVHTFYVADRAKSNFCEIARLSGGRCEALNINSSEGAEQLTHLVTAEILRNTGGSRGEELVQEYSQKYLKRSFMN